MVGQDQDQLQGQEQTKDDIAGEGEVEDEGLHGRHNPEKLSRLVLGSLTPVPVFSFNNSSVSSNSSGVSVGHQAAGRCRTHPGCHLYSTGWGREEPRRGW